MNLGYAVATSVETLRYKSERGWFDSRWEYRFFFNSPNPSSRTMAVGLTKPRTEMSTGKRLDSKAWPTHKAENLAAICEPIV
jgi:hypothetical protein